MAKMVKSQRQIVGWDYLLGGFGSRTPRVIFYQPLRIDLVVFRGSVYKFAILQKSVRSIYEWKASLFIDSHSLPNVAVRLTRINPAC